MANYKYVYDEHDAPPAEPVGEYKVKTAFPNKILIISIVSYFFLGGLGIIIAIYALQKVRNYHFENDGVTCKMVQIAKVLAILNLVITGLLYTVAIGWYFYLLVIIPVMYAPEASEAFILPVLSLICALC